ncbi:hypothetical protein FRX31_035429, partial [Thalictrum thalictroides]
MEENLDEDNAVVKATDGIKVHNNHTHEEDPSHIEMAIETQLAEVNTEVTEVLGGMKSTEEETTEAHHEHRGNINLPPPSSTQIISLTFAEQGNTQNRNLGKDIAEEYVNTEMGNLEEELAQVSPLAIEAPPFNPSRLLTHGDQSEEEQSEDEDNHSQEEENPFKAL